MRICILAFVAGVVLLQQQPLLPALIERLRIDRALRGRKETQSSKSFETDSVIT